MGKDLTTAYLGLQLRNPLVIAACPLTAEVDTLQHMESLGAAAAVMPSLFEEQIETPNEVVSQPPHLGVEPDLEEGQVYNRLANYNRGPEAYVRQVTRVKKAVSIPIVASLNGTTRAGWTRYDGE